MWGLICKLGNIPTLISIIKSCCSFRLVRWKGKGINYNLKMYAMDKVINDRDDSEG